MEKRSYRHDGKEYLEYISQNYQPLAELRRMYQEEGHRAWVNPEDLKNWKLTVELNTEVKS